MRQLSQNRNVIYVNFKTQTAKNVVQNMKANLKRFFQILLNALALVEKEELIYEFCCL